MPKNLIKYYQYLPTRTPQMGDVVYGEVSQLGFHTTLESVSARIHTIHDRTRAVFVFGNRYAPDHYEGLVPTEPKETVDLLSRSGVIGEMKHRNELSAVPTQIRLLGYLCDAEGKVINTRDHVLIRPKKEARAKQGAKLILCIGTAMNAGKSHAAAACCYGLSSMGKTVRAAKITGTASLKDILLMQDCGAEPTVDFSYFGFPSTYGLEIDDLMRIFRQIDLKYANNSRNYFVVEIADGILQRETAMLLHNEELRSRIHKLIFCAPDAVGVAGGLSILENTFKLKPDALSGLCSSSPLAIREIQTFTEIPILKSMERNYQEIYKLLK